MDNKFIILVKRVNSNKLSFNAAKTQYTDYGSNIKRMTNMFININETCNKSLYKKYNIFQTKKCNKSLIS